MLIKNKNENFHYWLGAIAVVLIDQLTKIMCLNFLIEDKEIILNSSFSLRLVFNEDLIMGRYNPFNSQWEFRLGYLLFCSFLSLLIYWLVNHPELSKLNNKHVMGKDWTKTGLFLLLGSIWGNGFDRMFRNGVIDFIHYKHFQEPIFNFADVIILVAIFALINGILCIYIKSMYDFIKFKMKDKISINE